MQLDSMWLMVSSREDHSLTPMLSLAQERTDCVQTESTHARRGTKQEAGAFLFAPKNVDMSPSKDEHMGPEKQTSADTLQKR